ncbi:hypothetical protein B0F90DRAFT_1011071 [Multifurca ochricompacta]|uniref:Uncharacterized protein n=1 Tax=Multifurca ochricompacta TaxID=376703 RepID=A0AAD4M212_9AGAM|nr:hypothetical protein B0F90DRAFT_1011071 [Multifurca ochricompacta]
MTPSHVLSTICGVISHQGYTPPGLQRYSDNCLPTLRMHIMGINQISAIREDATEDNCQAVVTHDAFWTILPPEPIVPRDVMMSPEERASAVIESWSVEFIGRAPLEGLKNHIAQELSVSSRYRYCCIVQSSGTGKSRLHDEFSKAHFMITIVLRAFRSNGFPPTDGQVRNFLKIEAWTRGGPTLAYSQAYHFLLALFEKTKETVAQWTDLSHRAERVLRFREFMSRGQNMESTGEDRENFYKDVVARAESFTFKST